MRFKKWTTEEELGRLQNLVAHISAKSNEVDNVLYSNQCSAGFIPSQKRPATFSPSPESPILPAQSTQAVKVPENASVVIPNREDTVSTIESSSVNEYPDGTAEFVVEKKHNLHLTIGWALATYGTNISKKKGTKTHYKYCLGVYKCPHCSYIERPKANRWKKSRGSEPKPPCTFCKLHSSCRLDWISCKCLLKIVESNERWVITHIGNHNHPKPHPVKPTSHAINDLSSIVNIAPTTTPKGLKIGAATYPPVSMIHPAFHNKDRVAYHRRKILKETSMQSTFTSILNLNNDVPFIRSSSFEPNVAHITLQTDDMVQQLSESRNCPFQTDSVHDMILDPNYDGEINVTFTSMFDIYIQRNIPVCISIMYGKTANHYEKHFNQVLACLSDRTYEEFKENLLGNSCDFSDAERIGFFRAVTSHVKDKFSVDINDDDIVPLYRFCDFHFKQSVTRIARNSGIVNYNLQHQFKQDVERLQNEEEYEMFEKLCYIFLKHIHQQHLG